MPGRSVRLVWKRYGSFRAARTDLASKCCFYVQATAGGRALRVGKATRGLGVRYRGGTGYALEAAAHGSRNPWFVAPVPASLASEVERELIWSHRSGLPY